MNLIAVVLDAINEDEDEDERTRTRTRVLRIQMAKTFQT
jgi:hypothetical protein